MPAASRTEITDNMPAACLTFFVPPNDGSDTTNRELLSRIRRTGKFDRSGTTFVTTEPNDMYRRGGQFPVFHVEESPAALRPLLGDGPGQPRLLPPGLIDDRTITQQGLFRQVHKFEFDDVSPESGETACILMAFKSMQQQHDPELITHWKTWTGARGLLVDFGTDVAPRSAAFYVRQRPERGDQFMYVVLIHVHVTEDTWCIVRHLVQRFRVERQFGYISVYKEHRLGRPKSGAR
ncbi:uncharacterized protein LOC122373966 [Amphibalanus amphitrite]|uniref:uncharacterized protein LOC122373966 n=1 Tax=Amphibalanus amphitrite TaxID=1232801 RepID=UPI001C908F42|nr:uncharacterized protein LOC122373966 [Amphibalanus amphitrite]